MTCHKYRLDWKEFGLGWGVDDNLQGNRGGQNIGNFSELKDKMYQEQRSEIFGMMRAVIRRAI